MVEVPGYGPRNAKIMVVGEAPASTEVREGRPFQGRAGQQLDSILKVVGIPRESLYITNACLTPVTEVGGNKERFFFTNGQPSPVFMRGIGQLIKDIQEIKPNVVVALGNYALWAFMQHQGITKWRGSILKSPLTGTKVIPTIHPAALLRGVGADDGGTSGGGGMWKMLTAVVHDFEKAKKQSGFPELRLRPRAVVLNPVGEALDYCMGRLMKPGARVVFDMETFGGTNLAYAGFSDYDPEWSMVVSMDTPERVAIGKAILENPETFKVGHNICAYDVPMLDSAGIHVARPSWDTMVAAHVLVPDLPKSLAFLQSIYTDMPFHKEEGKILRHTRTELERQQGMLYCGKDVLSCAEIAQVQPEFLRERRLEPVFERRMMLSVGALREQAASGFKADLLKLYQMAKSTEEKLKAAEKELHLTVGHEFNYNSHLQVKTVIYQERGVAPRYKDGKLTSDAHVLSDIAARNGDPVPKMVMKCRQLSKLLSNYYNAKILSPDGRIRTIQSVVGTKSARLNSSIPLWGPGIPIQTIPLAARSVFIPDPGYSIVECDGAQAEAVVVAYLANDPIHMDCFRTGKDVHCATAALLNGMTIEDWVKIPKPSQVRELAKTCNHELNYFAGPFMFMLTVNEEYDPEDPLSIKLDPETAKVLWHRYHEIRPALGAYWEWVRKQLRDNAMKLKSPLGWEFQFLDKWSDSMLRVAYSWIPQTTVGESTNIGILQVRGEMAAPFDGLEKDQEDIKKAGVRFMAQVHDSAVWQVPTEAVEEIGPKIMKVMEVPLYVNGYHIVVPIEGAYGPTWNKKEMKSLGVTRKTVEL